MEIAPSAEPVEITDIVFQMSGSIAKLGAALAKAQGSFTHAKADSTNPHFKSSYADLASVVDAIGPGLSAAGIARVQAPISRGSEVGVVTMLIHEGEWIRCWLWCRPTQNTPQAIGTVISYLRRYALAAITGIAQVDDDGNQGSGKGEGTAPPAAPAKRSRSTPPKLGPDDPTPRPEAAPVAPPDQAKIPPLAPGVPTAEIPAGNVPIYEIRGGKWTHVGSGPPLTKDQQVVVKILQREMDIPQDAWVASLTRYYGKTSSKTLTGPEADDLKTRLERRKGVQLSA